MANHRSRTSFGIAILLMVSGLASVHGPARPGRAESTEGPVQGMRAEGGVAYAFRSVPYAAAPNGALRFARPAAPAPGASNLNAHDFALACPQRLSQFRQVWVDGEPVDQVAGNEDGLALKVGDRGHGNRKHCVKKLARRLEQQGRLDRAERKAIKRCAVRARHSL